MELPKTILSIVEEWKRRCEKSGQSTDPLISMMNEGFKAMEIILKKDSSYKDIVRALACFDCERALSLKNDTVKIGDTRDLVYGFGECLHMVLSQLTRERNEVKEAGQSLTQVNAESVRDVLEMSISSDENAHPITNIIQENQSTTLEPVIPPTENGQATVFTIKQKDQVNVAEDSNPIVKKEPLWEGPGLSDAGGTPFSEIHGNGYLGFVGHPLIIKKEPENEEAIAAEDLETTHSETVDAKYRVAKTERSSRMVSKPLKFNEYVDYDETSDGEVKSKVFRSASRTKKRTSDKGLDESGSEKKKPRARSVKKQAARNASEVKCPECDYSTHSVDAWLGHLRFNHSSNPTKVGVALLCDCGHECVTVSHSRECDIANFAVIRTSQSKCVLCEVYPRTASGYAQHLTLKHGSTLAANGLYLMCSCGLKITRHKSDPEHTKRCNGRQFTIHKTNETELDAILRE
ncbi:hypothetical protein PENTCL1PPCAC_9287 [Pristionchus entomophagus]|uniref:C2H2-type domain-containing protein n=1 Tax=Pristionchus entomophagus TaxID=358040 RepID=A0AAV5SWH4_9BILA|nr:hypothetical protein PENTCL1PPCAC_9287 [Pristionchus entomophagus]